MQEQTRREFLKTMGFAAASAGAFSVLPGCAGTGQIIGAQRKKPNIIFFFTDDQRFDAIDALSNKHIVTPHMDSMVRNGTTFTNAYYMGGSSELICKSSRSMLLTGRALFHLDDFGKNIPRNHITLPEALRNAGYTTFHAGIWQADDESFARSFSAGDKNSKPMFGDEAIQFLRECRDDKPFFMYVSYLMYLSYAASRVRQAAPGKYEKMYDPDKIALPKNFMPQPPFDNGELNTHEEKQVPCPRTPEVVREKIADYYSIITHGDAQIGRLLAVLKEKGQAENTIIVLTSDQGLAVGRHGLMGKQNLYEHSVRVPLVISGPGIPKGQKRDAFCYLLDIFPTLCDLTGISIPNSVEGKSLAGIISKPKHKGRDVLLFAYKDIQRAVRDKRYKLIEYFVNGKRTTQLFDLQTDPWELNNLADDPAYAARLKRLRKELLRWKEELGDKTKFWQGYGCDV